MSRVHWSLGRTKPTECDYCREIFPAWRGGFRACLSCSGEHVVCSECSLIPTLAESAGNRIRICPEIWDQLRRLESLGDPVEFRDGDIVQFMDPESRELEKGKVGGVYRDAEGSHEVTRILIWVIGKNDHVTVPVSAVEKINP